MKDRTNILCRGIRLRIYPTLEQKEQIDRTIDAVRFVWNRCFFDAFVYAKKQRKLWVKSQSFFDMTSAEFINMKKEAFKKVILDTKTYYRYLNEARQLNIPELANPLVMLTPIHRALYSEFTPAVKASYGLKQNGSKRAVKAGEVQQRSIHDDARHASLEFQVQNPIKIDLINNTINLRGIGQTIFADNKNHKMLTRLLTQCDDTINTAFSTITLQRIIREKDEYYVSFSHDISKKELINTIVNPLGLDLGVAIPVCSSEGVYYGLGMKEKLIKLDIQKGKLQRSLARRIGSEKGQSKSARWLKLNKRVNDISKREANIRKEFANKLAHELVNNYDAISMEDLSIDNMTGSASGDKENPGINVAQKRGLNRSILNIGWGNIVKQTEAKFEEHGKNFIKIDARNTSRECPNCGHTHKDNRPAQAKFQCVNCGEKYHADTKAAITILGRGMKQWTVDGKQIFIDKPVEVL